MTNNNTQREEHYELYWEQVRKLVDGVTSSIVTKHITGRGEALSTLRNSVSVSAYVRMQDGAIDVLRYSEHPNEWFANYADLPRFLRESAHVCMTELGTRSVTPNRAYTESIFPFEMFAEAAMRQDAFMILIQSEAYRSLPNIEFDVTGILSGRWQSETPNVLF